MKTMARVEVSPKRLNGYMTSTEGDPHYIMVPSCQSVAWRGDRHGQAAIKLMEST